MSFTQFPNEIIDDLLPKLSPNGWKLFCFVWRKTAGWQKSEDYISYGQIKDGTGIVSRTTIKKAIDELSQHIVITPALGRGKYNLFNVDRYFSPKQQKRKGTENRPFTEKSPETVPFTQEKSPVSDKKSPETGHTKDTITIDIKDTTTSLRIAHNDKTPEEKALDYYQEMYGTLEGKGTNKERKRQDFLDCIKCYGGEKIIEALDVAWNDRARGPDWAPSWGYVKKILEGGIYENGRHNASTGTARHHSGKQQGRKTRQSGRPTEDTATIEAREAFREAWAEAGAGECPV